MTSKLSAEDRALIEKGRKMQRARKRAEEAGELEPVSKEFAARMQSEADVGAFLNSPEGKRARELNRKIDAMSYDELLAKFPDVLCADAHDEEDAERERDPSLYPAHLEDRTMETCHATEKKDAARERRRPEKE